MGNLVNHALDGWRLFQFHSLVDSSQAQPMNTSELFCAPPKFAFDQSDLDFSITHQLPPVRGSPQQTFLDGRLLAVGCERWSARRQWPAQH